MRGRYTIICCQKHFKEYSIGSHQCNNIVMHKISFFTLKILCDYISAFSNGDRGFMVKIIVIRVLPTLFYHC